MFPIAIIKELSTFENIKPMHYLLLDKLYFPLKDKSVQNRICYVVFASF